MATLQIPNHMHCAICNQAIPYADPKTASGNTVVRTSQAASRDWVM